jgi:uncharacterized membrane protein
MSNDANAVHKRRLFLVRVFMARPRLFFSVLFGIAVAIFLPHSLADSAITRSIIAWNAGAGLYLCLAARMMFSSTHEKMSLRSITQDEGRVLILVLVALAAMSTLAAIVVELAMAKNLQGSLRYTHFALAGVTIAISWLFMHTMFALHYAHDFYASLLKGAHGGLIFPNEGKPDYADFLYFALIIGTSAQTADVSFASRTMRRTGLFHCVLAFFFNTTLLALTINIASGLF